MTSQTLEQEYLVATYQSLESPINFGNDSSIISNSPLAKLRRKRYKQYPYRWINLIIFVFTAFGNSIVVQTCSPIAPVIEKLYDVNQFTVSFCTLIFYIVSPFVAPIVNKILDEYGLKIGFSIAAVLQIVGSGIRLLVHYNFYYVLLGQIISSLSIMFIMSSPAKFSATWFATRARPLVTTLAAFSVAVAGTVGIIIPTIFVNDKSDKKDVQTLMLVEFIIVTSVWGLNLIFFKDKPPTPPSYSASCKKDNLKQSTQALRHNKNYLFLLVSYSIFLGFVNSFAIMVSFFIEPFGYKPATASKIMFLATIAGLIGSVINGFFLQKFKKYKLQGFILISLGLIFIFILYIVLYNEITWALYLVACFFGLSIFPIYPTLIEFSAEVVFPVGEATSTGWLQAGGQLYTFICGLILNTFMNGVEKQRSFYGFIFYFCNLCIAFVFLILTTEDLKRLKQEIISVVDKPLSKENLQSIIEGKDIFKIQGLVDAQDIKKSLVDEQLIF